jgi:histidine triad (HIT) family protein
MTDCLFCKIAEGKIPARIVHQDKDTVAFEDIDPQAPVHLLVMPRRHVRTVNELGHDDDQVMGKLFRVAATLAREKGCADSGYRVVVNANADGGQVVFHLHMHVMGGRVMTWPPGLGHVKQSPPIAGSADARRIAALRLPHISAGYARSARLALLAPRPPGSVRGFPHRP